jgi:hypothetical protein
MQVGSCGSHVFLRAALIAWYSMWYYRSCKPSSISLHLAQPNVGRLITINVCVPLCTVRYWVYVTTAYQAPSLSGISVTGVNSLINNGPGQRNKKVEFWLVQSRKTTNSIVNCTILHCLNEKFRYCSLRDDVQCLSPSFNALNAELNPICHFLASLGVHHFLHVSRIGVKSLILRLLMSCVYIYIYIYIYIYRERERESTYTFCF